MLEKMLEKLKNPSLKYRGIPFWSWNDDMDETEVRRQVRDMAESGFGGYFIHARAGLKTPYFGEKWMQCIRACIEEGLTAGIKTWLYDENGYPSGFAGGVVPEAGEDFQQKHLRFELIKAGDWQPSEISLAVYRTSGDFEKIDPAMVSSGEKVLHAFYSLNPYYSDLLNPKAIQAFIESTYEPYYKRFKAYFGEEIPGIFTDEPQYGRSGIPWSVAIRDRFHEKCGYDLLDCLSALYFKTPGYHKIRYDFWNMVTDLFVNGMAKQLGDWCESHHCTLTGHVLLEEDMRFQTLCSGSAMGVYRHFQMPGIDWLGKATGNPVIVKQVVSAAAQTGRKLVLSEMFAAAGWNTTLSEMKHIAEWQYVLGINLTCAHLYAFSLAGERKRDHPPGISYQSNWWRESRTFNDYFARLGQLLSEGETGGHLLVLHPLRSGWIAFDAGCTESSANAELNHLDLAFEKLSCLLCGMHIDYHYGDEGMLAEMGRVEGKSLFLGKCLYKAVLIPEMTTMEPASIGLLMKFAEAGGRLYCLEKFPTMINGVPSPVLDDLRRCCTGLILGKSSLMVLQDTGCKPVSVLDENGDEIDGIYHKISRQAGGTVLYLVNMDETAGHEAWVELNVPAVHLNRPEVRTVSACSLNLLDCTSMLMPMDAEGRIALRFEPCQSHVLFFSESVPDLGPSPQIERTRCKKTTVRLQNDWKVKGQSPNVMVLDICRYATENGPWSEPMPVMRVQKQLLALGRTVHAALEFTVSATCLFDAKMDMLLVIEHAGDFEVEVNGIPVVSKNGGWWKDKAFGKVDVTGTMQSGRNSILLRTVFRNSDEVKAKMKRAIRFEAEMNMLTYLNELENIFLVGDFSVRSDSPAEVGTFQSFVQSGPYYLDQKDGFEKAELTTDGYPFFTGNVLLEQNVEIMDIHDCRSIMLSMKSQCAYSKLHVNGTFVKTFLWQPYEAEIRSLVVEGINTIGVELVSTDRNLFGPHHNPRGELHNLGPIQFTDAVGWSDRYSLVKFGVGSGAEIVVYRD